MPRCTKEDLTIKPPTLEGYRDSEEVFYCETTKEIFRDYDEFFRRNMLINSIIWACEVTGRENLTYAEALKSEKKASEKAKGFREILKGPTLLLAKIAQQSSHNELGRLLYQFFKEQYLVGEEVMPCETAQRHCKYEIIDIIKPKSKDANSNNKKTSGNSPEATSNATTPTKNVFKYKLRKITKNAEKQNIIVNVEQIRRSQVDYSFDRLVCFLKDNTTIVDGIICPKENIYKKYVTDHNITFQSIFACELPQWKAKKRKSEKKERNKKDKNGSGGNENNKKIKTSDNENKDKKQQSLSQYLIKTNGETARNNNDNAENKKNLLIEMERKRKEREAKQLELEKKKAEMNVKAEQETIRVLTKCDDLERDDQKPLPQYKPIKSIVSLKYFGDLLQIQEFLHSFSPILSSYDVFQKNITFNQMCRALTVREVAGPLSDLFQVLLSTIFSCQFEENEDSTIDYRELQTATTEPHITINRATKTHNFINKHYSHKIYELPIDSLTLSELIRLHLLSSGAATTEKCTKWRYMYRMGYSNTEDPGLLLRMKQPHILRSLKLYTIYQLPMDDIIKIIKCLIDQILTYQSTITILEERSEKLQKLKQEIRNLYIAENKRLLLNTNKKKNLTNEYNLKCLETQDQEEKKKLMNELNIKVAKALTDEDKDKKEFDYKLTNARSQIFDHIINLGMDRCYRQYFIFESICGLFIEHPKETLDNNCLENPPQNCTQLANLPHSKQKLKPFFMTRLKEMEKENSSKKNNNNNNKSNDTKMIKIIASIGELNKGNSRLNGIINKNTVAGVIESSSSTSQAPATSTVPVPAVSNDNDDNVKLVEYGPQPYNPSQYELYMCTGDPNNCIVHNNKDLNRYQWSYINTEDELESLIDALNPLGKRESVLREQLITYKSLILRHILDFPKIGLSFDDKIAENQFIQQIKSEKKYLNSNFGFHIDADINEVMYNTLLDKILQFESDISKGHLGRLKIENIEKWRTDLQNNSYDSQCKKLIYGIKSDNNDDNDDNDDGYHEEEEEGEFDDPGYGLGNTTEIKSEDSSSDDDLLPLHDSPQTRKLVQNLASALLQIEQAIEQKFLKEPFGIKNEVKDKEINETRLALGRIRLKNWESSLMRSTSYSQIFLHLNVISDAVKWTKSSNQAKCMKCRKKSLPEQMLLCDECNGGMHMFCMEPKLTSIPEGNWYCQKCTVKLGLENKIKVAKKKKVFKMDDVDDEQNSEDDDEDEKIEEEEDEEIDEEEEETVEEEDEIDDEEEEDDEDDEESSTSESEIILSTKRSSDRIKKNKVISDEDETEEEFENKVVINGKTKSNHDDVSEDDSERICKECDFDGGDVMCNTCESWYHLECTNLRRPPRGRWECTQCKNKIKTKDKNLKRKMDEGTYNDSTSSEENDEPLVKRSKQHQQKHVIEKHNLRKRTSDEEKKKTNGIKARRSRHLADNSLPLNSVILYDLLDSIMKNDDAWPFLRPVLPSQVPDYYDVIKKPMDFGQIKSKLNMGKYRENKDVMDDIELVFRNCDLYNTSDNYVYRIGKSLEYFVYNKCRELKLPFKPSDMIKNDVN